MRRATPCQLDSPAGRGYFYPRSPCGERLRKLADALEAPLISIHALLAESDRKYHTADRVRAYISIHALLAESDIPPSITPTASRNFYPRSPCGERQAIYPSSTPPKEYFYPRSPCGERRDTVSAPDKPEEFLSTLSLRRATCAVSVQVGGDVYFYPRSPCGERLACIGFH